MAIAKPLQVKFKNIYYEKKNGLVLKRGFINKAIVPQVKANFA